MPTLRKIIYLLTEQGIIFERTVSAILVDPFQEKLLLEILAQFEEGGRRSYPKAVEATIVHHGLGQGMPVSGPTPSLSFCSFLAWDQSLGTCLVGKIGRAHV